VLIKCGGLYSMLRYDSSGQAKVVKQIEEEPMKKQLADILEHEQGFETG